MLIGRLFVAVMGVALVAIGFSGVISGETLSVMIGVVGIVIGAPVIVFGLSSPPKGMNFSEYKSKYGSWGDNSKGYTRFD